MANTAWSDGHHVLYHWQRFDAARLEQLLSSQSIYCSSPAGFNDPWDCKPHFNTDILNDQTELEKHIAWSIDICRRHNHDMSEADIAKMATTLRHDKNRTADLISEISARVSQTNAERYRVYCLGPNATNLLMWAHYGDSHKGICLEFSLQNEVLCTAHRCEYFEAYPLIPVYTNDPVENLRILLAKSKVWEYENEYRLVAQERSHAITKDTLMTDKNMLQLPRGALSAVIVGCQADFEQVQRVVSETAAEVKVKRAVRVPNRYEIRIEPCD